MTHQFKKLLSLMLTLVTVFAFQAASVSAAGQLLSVSASLSTPQSLTASNHTVQFNVASTTNIKAIQFKYVRAASTNNAVPLSLVTTSVTLPGGSNDTITIGGTPTTGWAAASSTNGTVLVTKAGGTGARTAGDTISVSLDNITNNDATAGGGNQCDGISNSDTCYIQVTTWSDVGATVLVDQGVTSYTVITAVSVSATVDPSLTMQIQGITTLATLNTNDTNAACTGNDITATATAIPYSNIQVNVPQCAQQSVTVATNAANGAIVYLRGVGSTSTTFMVGINASNHFTPFNSGGASFGSPQAWGSGLHPTGAQNSSSGWYGIRVLTPGSQHPGVSGFGSSGVYAPITVTNSGLGDAIYNNSNVGAGGGPDNGSSPTYVTQKIEAGAAQPADVYAGTEVYTTVATF